MKRRCIAVAYSGGRDSSALLHATLAAAAKQGLEVIALHVHHGLSEQADAWLAHCEAQCRRWARAGRPVSFAFRRLEGRPGRGESVEAWARRERYRALRELASEAGAHAVLLAHHRRDQAETFLLQALRSAGTAGLAGMPPAVERDGVRWLRPWLDRSDRQIDAYVRRHRLRHVTDDSNADARFTRNRLRLSVWPALADAFPQAEAALATSARWAAQATELLLERARDDLSILERADGGLELAGWRTLTSARRSNVLRHWLHTHAATTPASLVLRLLDELEGSRVGRWPHPAGELRLHRGVLRFVAAAQDAMPSLSGAGEVPARETSLQIVRAGRYTLPGWGGVLRAKRVSQDGVPFAWLGRLELRPRVGAERFQAGLGRPPRSLKKQYQAADVPAWERDGPLVYSGGQLVFVPGLGLDARVIGLPEQPLATLSWSRMAGRSG